MKKIDLSNETEKKFLEIYINALLNAKSAGELDFLTLKLAHFYDVIEMAKTLISKMGSAVGQEDKKILMDCVILHDLGRTKQFKTGIYDTKIDHGKMGSEMIKEIFPDKKMAQITTLWHNKCPSDKDPKKYQFYLDFVRDTDILANIKHRIEKMIVFLKQMASSTPLDLYIDEEIITAQKEKRSYYKEKMKKENFFSTLVGMLNWKYNLRVPESFVYIQEEGLFAQLRETILTQAIPFIEKDKSKCALTQKTIQDLYADI